MKLPGKTTIAIIALLILAVTAMLKGIDGAMLASTTAAIAGLGGYSLGARKK